MQPQRRSATDFSWMHMNAMAMIGSSSIYSLRFTAFLPRGFISSKDRLNSFYQILRTVESTSGKKPVQRLKITFNNRWKSYELFGLHFQNVERNLMSSSRNLELVLLPDTPSSSEHKSSILITIKRNMWIKRLQ